MRILTLTLCSHLLTPSQAYTHIPHTYTHSHKHTQTYTHTHTHRHTQTHSYTDILNAHTHTCTHACGLNDNNVIIT